MTETLKIGDAVRLVNETYEEHHGLVTAIHGHASVEARNTMIESADYYNEDPALKQAALEAEFKPPLINAVYITSDASKRDPYGLQVERLSSLQHVTGVQQMPRPGRYWEAL